MSTPKEKTAKHLADKDLSSPKMMMQFICPKCDRDITWAYEYASVYCRACDRWISADQLKRTNPAKIHPEKNQLILFQ